jgi:creatine kinase
MASKQSLLEALKSHASKPADASDISTIEQARAEIKALRVLFNGVVVPVVDVNYPPIGIAPMIQKLPRWIQVGCGDRAYYCTEKNATFAPDGVTPDKMPDFSKYTNHMGEQLRKNPALWDMLKNRKTKNGVTLAMCIKTGVDNPSHPYIKTVGMTACDEESYETFKELFDPVIAARHNGYAAGAIQPTNMDLTKLSNTDVDPYNKYVLTARVRTGRSVRGFKLPPQISFEDRRKLEKLITTALLKMDGDLAGEYFPLHGSHSFAAKPNGMSLAKEDELRKCGNLFQEPDSTLLLASGMGRHWPDGRGVFHNNGKNLFVWCGEEDHMRIVSMQGLRSRPTPEGKKFKDVVARFMRACNAVATVLKSHGADFMHNKHHGWILTCPSNLGTGMRAGVMVKLEKLSKKKDFKAMSRNMGLQVRGFGGVDSAAVGGTYDISNAARIGQGEVDLVNITIEGVRKLVDMEDMLQNGKDAQVDAMIAKYM